MGGIATPLPAESSTVDNSINNPRVDMESWTPAERDEYFLSGKPPEATPAEPASQTGKEIDAAAVDGAVKPATGEPGADQGGKPSEPTGAEKRIKELLAQVNELKSKLQPAPEPGKPGEEKKDVKPAEDVRPVKPVSTAFDTWEAYEEARDEYTDKLAAWRAREAIRDYETAQGQKAKQSKVDEANRSIQQAWDQRVAGAKAKPEYADFDEVVTDSIPVNRTSGQFILDSPHGAEIMYHLGKHPDLASRMATLSPSETMREVVKLELQFSQPKEVPAKPRRPLSEPETVLNGGGAAGADPVKAAVTSGDVGGYMQLMNSRESAR